MLYLPEDSPNPQRIQGTFIKDEEVIALVEYWRNSLKHQATNNTNALLDASKLYQMALPTWDLEPVEVEKRQSRPAKADVFTKEALFEHLMNYLLHETVFVDGTPLPVPLRKLEFEDRLLVAEAITWRGYLGSGETLNRKLKTKQGPELRDELIRRGLLDRNTQRPLRPSEHLAPLLIECGIIEADNHEPPSPLVKDDAEQHEQHDETGMLPSPP
jgi:DNA segregation ATPase FtsK/SpoIIIE-like protein